jgi:hypothetical protein
LSSKSSSTESRGGVISTGAAQLQTTNCADLQRGSNNQNGSCAAAAAAAAGRQQGMLTSMAIPCAKNCADQSFTYQQEGMLTIVFISELVSVISKAEAQALQAPHTALLCLRHTLQTPYGC